MSYADKLKSNEALANFSTFMPWFGPLGQTLDPKKTMPMYQNNKDRLIQKLGKWNGTFRSEFLHYIWEFPVNGIMFYIFTGKRGTSFEVQYSKANHAAILSAIPIFLDKIYKIVK